MTGRVFVATPRVGQPDFTVRCSAANAHQKAPTYNLKNATETKIAANTQIRSMSSIVLSA